jgi:hypothetical protein
MAYIQTGQLRMSYLSGYKLEWLAITNPFPTRAKHSARGRVAFELRVRKLMAVQRCQEGDKLAPC